MATHSTSPRQAASRNGVDVGALYATLDAVRQDAGLAAFQFRARNRWISGGHNRSTLQAFHGCRREDDSRAAPFVLDADEPPVLLGADHGANPVEYVLHALAACLTTSMVYHAAARGIDIGAVASTLRGDLDLRGFLGLSNDVRKGYHDIEVKMRVQSSASAAVLRELAMYSPVFDMISRAVPVTLVIDTAA